jgi:hypothetical protein
VSAIWLALLIVKDAAVPLTVTDVAPVKCDPLTVTLAPALPLVGEKLVMAGAGFWVDPPEPALPPPHAASIAIAAKSGAANIHTRQFHRAVNT